MNSNFGLLATIPAMLPATPSYVLRRLLGNPKHKLIHLNDGKYGNEHSWISNIKAKDGFSELPEPVKIERIEWGRDRNQRYKDRLPTKYRIEGALDPGQWSILAVPTPPLRHKIVQTNLRRLHSGRRLPKASQTGPHQGNRRHRYPLQFSQSLRRQL